MTCSKNFGRLLQVGCLGLIGTLTFVGCGGSEKTTPRDGGGEAGILGQTGAAVNANPATVDVGTVDVLSTSSPVTVKITNTGTAAGVLTVTPSGTGIAATGCTGSLGVGLSCTLSITATPAAAGAIVGNVSVSIAGGNTISISVSGQAVVPGNFGLSPTSISLGNVAVGATVQATVIVTANAALTGLSTGVQGADLKLDASSTCLTTLAAGASCSVVVNFTGTAVGSPTGDAVVVSQGGVTKNVPVTANVLTGAKLAATPTTAAFAAAPGATSAAVDINIGNTGGLPTGQIAVALGGTNAADFTVVSDTCSIVTLAAGVHCVVSVAYKPAATATVDEAGTLTITDKGAGASVATVVLSGTPNLPSTLTITGGPSLGSVAPGVSGAEVVFTVTNTSATPSGALVAAVSSPLITISSNTCAAVATLAQGATCTVGLKLTPPASAVSQSIAALLTVTAATGKASASVTGSIVSGAALSATPPSVSFGSVPVNQSSAVQTVTVKNTGATATGVLAAVLSGPGAAQVAIMSNTCTAALAPAATCTIAVQFNPTDTTGVSGVITVTDTATSLTIPMVGTGLAPSVLTVAPNQVDFGSVVLGYAEAQPATTITVGDQTTVYQLLTVSLVAGATTDSGTISTAITGAAATDFAVDATKSNCTTIQPGQSCNLAVTFTPTAVGARAASLTVTGTKGGVYVVSLKGTALPLVDITPDGCADATGAPVDFDPAVTPRKLTDSGLDFGQQTLGRAGGVCMYTVTVRGATLPAATTTTASVSLTTTTPPDFRNVTDTTFGTSASGVGALATNPCDAAVLGLTANTGAPAGDAPSSNWSKATSFWTCDFYIQFTPQTSKSAAADDKTATIAAQATAGGSDSKTLTGTATGPLTINPATFDFGTVNSGTASAMNSGDVTLTVSESGVETFTITNNGVAAEGPLSVALAPSTDFAVVTDTCTPAAAATPTMLAVNHQCYVTVMFVPTSAGAKTATLTVTSASSGETTNPPATLKGNGGTPLAIGIAPTTAAFADTAQANMTDFTTFTISNPAGASLTGKLTYGFGSCGALSPFDGDTLAESDFELFTLSSSTTGYPAGACGDNNTKQLDSGANCTIQVRFRPTATAIASAATNPRKGTLQVCVGGQAGPKVTLSGNATPQLTLSGAAVTVVDNTQVVDFGDVAQGGAKSVSFNVNNNGATDVTLAIPQPAPFTVAADSGCKNGTVLPAGQPCALKYTVTANVSTPISAPNTVIGVSLPAASVGTVSTSVTLKANPVPGPQLKVYGITGDNTTTPLIEFGSVAINSAAPSGSGILTVWFTNAGGLTATGVSGALTLTGGATDGFLLAAENPGTCASLQSLAAGAKCSVNLIFKPTTTGQKNRHLHADGNVRCLGQRVPARHRHRNHLVIPECERRRVHGHRLCCPLDSSGPVQQGVLRIAQRWRRHPTERYNPHDGPGG